MVDESFETKRELFCSLAQPATWLTWQLHVYQVLVQLFECILLAAASTRVCIMMDHEIHLIHNSVMLNQSTPHPSLPAAGYGGKLRHH